MDQVTRSLVHVYCSSGMLPNKVLYTDITFTDARTGLQCHEYYIWKLHLAICKTYIILDKDMGNGEKKYDASPVSLISFSPFSNTLPDVFLLGFSGDKDRVSDC